MNATEKPKQTRVPRQTDGLPLQRINALKVNGLRKRPDPEYISDEELAYRWRSTKATIRYYIKRGLIKKVKLMGRRKVLFNMEEIKRIEREAEVK